MSICHYKLLFIFTIMTVLSLVLITPISCAADLNASSAANPGRSSNQANVSIPDLTWTTTFGNNGGNSVGTSLVITTTGDYVLAGSTNASGNGGLDVYLVKTDANGVMQWQKTFGGPYDDEAFGIIQARDGNYVIAGYTRSSGSGDADVYLIKVDDNGNALWEKTYGGQADDFGYALLESPDGGYVIAGSTRSSGNGGSDAYLIKTDANGALQWQKTYGGTGDDQVNSINATADGGYVISGWTRSYWSNMEIFLVKTDASGNLQWQNYYPWSTRSNVTLAYSAMQLEDGSYIVNGVHFDDSGDQSVRLLSVNPDGSRRNLTTIDQNTGSTSTLYNDSYFKFQYKSLFARSMIIANDGNYVIAGTGINDSTGNSEIYVFEMTRKYDITWNIPWAKKISLSANDSVQSIRQTPDGGYILTGRTYDGNGHSKALLQKLGDKPAAVAQEAQPDLGRAAAAVAVGAGLGFLGIFWGRIQEILDMIYAKMQAWLKPLFDLINSLLPVDTLVDYVVGYVKTWAKSLLFKQESKIKKPGAVSRVPFMAGFSSLEMLVVAVTSLLLGIAFMITKKIALDPGDIALYLVVAGLATMLHDLTHRYVAYRYKVTSEYQFWFLGTIVMFITTFFFGIVYSVPARTLINDVKKLGLKEQAIIALSGPMMSMGVTLVFFLLVPIGGWFKVIGLLGVSMNLLSAVYSLMPFDPMDGNKLYTWKKAAWAAIFLPLFIIYMLIAVYLL